MNEKLSDKFNKLYDLIKKDELSEIEENQKADLIRFFKRIVLKIFKTLFFNCFIEKNLKL